MKALLLYRDRDFEVERAPQRGERPQRKVASAPSKSEDAPLSPIWSWRFCSIAMAGKDPLVYDVVRKALLTSVSNDVDTILYRQQAVRDCLANPDVIHRMYALANEVFQRQTKIWGHFREYSDRSVGLLGRRDEDLCRRVQAPARVGRPVRGEIQVGSVCDSLLHAPTGA